MVYSSYKHQRILYHWSLSKHSYTISQCLRHEGLTASRNGIARFLKKYEKTGVNQDREDHQKLHLKFYRLWRIKCNLIMKQLLLSYITAKLCEIKDCEMYYCIQHRISKKLVSGLLLLLTNFTVQKIYKLIYKRWENIDIRLQHWGPLVRATSNQNRYREN